MLEHFPFIGGGQQQWHQKSDRLYVFCFYRGGWQTVRSFHP